VFGMRLHPILHYYRMHDGDDIGGTCGEPIWAAQSGVVVKAEMGNNGGSGNNIWIEHGDINGVDVQSGYLHMLKFAVKVGQKVDKGDVIGYGGLVESGRPEPASGSSRTNCSPATGVTATRPRQREQ